MLRKSVLLIFAVFLLTLAVFAFEIVRRKTMSQSREKGQRGSKRRYGNRVMEKGIVRDGTEYQSSSLGVRGPGSQPWLCHYCSICLGEPL